MLSCVLHTHQTVSSPWAKGHSFSTNRSHLVKTKGFPLCFQSILCLLTLRWFKLWVSNILVLELHDSSLLPAMRSWCVCIRGNTKASVIFFPPCIPNNINSLKKWIRQQEGIREKHSSISSTDLPFHSLYYQKIFIKCLGLYNHLSHEYALKKLKSQGTGETAQWLSQILAQAWGLRVPEFNLQIPCTWLGMAMCSTNSILLEVRTPEDLQQPASFTNSKEDLWLNRQDRVEEEQNSPNLSLRLRKASTLSTEEHRGVARAHTCAHTTHTMPHQLHHTHTHTHTQEAEVRGLLWVSGQTELQ